MTVPERDHRRETTTVLAEFERAIGSFYLTNKGKPDALREPTIALLQGHADLPALDSDVGFVQDSYLLELVASLANLDLPTTLRDAVSELVRFVNGIPLGAIRNACAHPNRPFTSHFWYCTTALATHPSVFKLELTSVVAQLEAAIRGVYFVPPDIWFSAISDAAIPSNLSAAVRAWAPSRFVGRRRELTELLKQLHNPRHPVIAVTGSGGTGKTALVLEALKALQYDIKARENFERIIFVSAKSETITIDGPAPTRPDFDTFATLRSSVANELGHEATAEAFASALRQSATERILLCIDNLESALLASPEEFSRFNDELPPVWRLLITSRVQIEAASRLIVLSTMEISDRRSLVRAYASEKSIALDDSSAESVALKCMTPLVVRLALDFLRLGGAGATEAIASATDISASFAFSNLLRFISERGERVLKVLFAVPEFLPVEIIAHLADLSIDDAVGALVEAHQSGLVNLRIEQTARQYALERNLADHLRQQPNYAASLATILSNYNRLRLTARIVTDSEHSPLDTLAVEGVSDPVSIASLTQIARVMARPGANFQNELRRLRRLDDSATKRRLEAFAYSRLGDLGSAIGLLRKNVEVSSGDHRSKFLLSYCLKRSQDLVAARALARELMDAGFHENTLCSIGERSQILQTYVLSTLWLAGEFQENGAHTQAAELYAEIGEITSKWMEKADELRATLGILHITHTRRATERHPADERRRALEQCINIFEDLYDANGVLPWSFPELTQLLEQIHYVSIAGTNAQLESLLERFLSKHICEILQRDYKRELADYLELLTPFPGLRERIRETATRRATEGVADEILQPPSDPALVRAQVCRSVKNSSYAFAEDERGTIYYCHASTFVGGMPPYLERGRTIWIEPGELGFNSRVVARRVISTTQALT